MYQQPDYPAALGLLSHLNSDELKEILNDEEKFEAVLKDVKQVKDWETEKEMLLASNKSLAEFNLSKEPELAEAKQKIAELSQQGEEICQTIKEKLEEFKSKSSGVSIDTTLALLQTAAAEAEEQSDKIADDFINGQIDAEKFLEDFSALRKTMHLRRVRAEKMAELIRRPQTGGLFGENGIPPYPQINPGHQPNRSGPQSNVPYPLGPVAMPMPGMFPNYY